MDPNNQNPTTPGPMPSTEDAGVGVPVPPPTVPHIVEEPVVTPAPTPVIPVVETKPKARWGKGALVGAIGAILVLVVGVFVGTGVVTNLQNKVNPEKKAAQADDDCKTAGGCFNGAECIPAGDSRPQTNADSGCSYKCVGPGQWELLSCPSGGGAGSPEADLGCGGTGQYPCGGGVDRCSGKCDGNLSCPSVQGDDKCGQSLTSGGGDTKDKQGCVGNNCPGGNQEVSWVNGTAVIPPCCVGWRYTCQGDVLERGCTLSAFKKEGPIRQGSVSVDPVACGTTVQADVSCYPIENGVCQSGGNSLPTSFKNAYGGTCVTQQQMVDCGGTCSTSDTRPRNGCLDGLSCTLRGGNTVCWGTRCETSEPTPTPTPTPPPASSASCQRLEYYRDGAMLPGGKNDIRVGDVITVRGFASVNNTTVSNIRFTVNAGGVAQVYSGTGLQLVGGLWQADSPPITIAATSYSISATPIFP